MTFEQFTEEMLKTLDEKKYKKTARITQSSILLTPSQRNKLGDRNMGLDLFWDKENREIKVSPSKTGFKNPIRSLGIGKSFCRYFKIEHRGECEVEFREGSLFIKVPEES